MFHKISFSVIISAFILLTASCSLNEKIYDSPTTDSFIQNESDALAMLNGVYAELSGFNCFKSNIFRTILYGGDDAAVLTNAFLMFNNRTVPTTNQYFTPWGSFYKVINNANAMLEVLDKPNNLSDPFKNRIKGELHFLRGFCYFYLVRLHGGVPVLKESVKGESNFYPKKNTVDEVYALIFDDFKQAGQNCLPFSKQPANEFGHATKGAAQAMRSLAYLTYADYTDLQGGTGSDGSFQLAKNYADSVILSNEYTLLNNYADLFNVSAERNAYKEVIFAIQQTRDGTTSSNGGSLGSELPSTTQPANRYHVSGDITNGKGTGAFRIQPWFYDLCTTGDYLGDYRSEVSFLTRFPYQGTSTETITYPEVKTSNEKTEQYPYMDKYKDPDGYLSSNNENDFFIIRLSEVYLIKAEAENELNGPTPTAYEAFNKLRARARLANGTARLTPANLAMGLNKEEFRMSVFNERGLELVGEGHRWFDAIRMKYMDTRKTMIQYRYEDFYPTLAKTAPSYNTKTNLWEGGKIQPTNVVPWSAKFLIWPIPSAEIDANPSMIQNPGW